MILSSTDRLRVRGALASRIIARATQRAAARVAAATLLRGGKRGRSFRRRRRKGAPSPGGAGPPAPPALYGEERPLAPLLRLERCGEGLRHLLRRVPRRAQALGLDGAPRQASPLARRSRHGPDHGRKRGHPPRPSLTPKSQTPLARAGGVFSSRRRGLLLGLSDVGEQ